MDYREALFGLVNAAILFVPVLVAVVSAALMGQPRDAARDRRMAAYRRSAASRLLILND